MEEARRFKDKKLRKLKEFFLKKNAKVGVAEREKVRECAAVLLLPFPPLHPLLRLRSPVLSFSAQTPPFPPPPLLPPPLLPPLSPLPPSPHSCSSNPCSSSSHFSVNEQRLLIGVDLLGGFLKALHFVVVEVDGVPAFDSQSVDRNGRCQEHHLFDPVTVLHETVRARADRR